MSAAGRYSSAADVVADGLRLIEEREARLRSLRDLLDASIAEGGSYSDDDMEASLEATEVKLADQGL